MGEAMKSSPYAGIVKAVLAAAIIGALGATDAAAQDAGLVGLGKTIYKDKADCAYCHGWSGNGVGDPRSENGANLRETNLDRDQIIEVTKCGRPGTGMPHHDRLAYTDKRCFDLAAADLGTNKPPEAPVSLSVRELQAVADYIMAKVKGLTTEPLLQECVDYFGATAAQCNAYRR
jgi:mono/diheme cytochrome c family protein